MALTFAQLPRVQDGLHRGRRRPRRRARQRRDLPGPAALEVRPGRQQQLPAAKKQREEWRFFGWKHGKNRGLYMVL